MKNIFLFIIACISFSPVSPFSYSQHQVKINLINKTGFDFIDVFISPTGENKWGKDLTIGVLEDMEGQDLTITMPEEICEFDLRAVKPDSSELVFENLNLCKMPIITLLYEFNEPLFVQDFILENRTDLTFSEIYVKESLSSIWGMNVLGANALTRNEKAVISFVPGTKTCIYDIKGVLINGKEIIYPSINLCNQMHVELFRYQGRSYFGFD